MWCQLHEMVIQSERTFWHFLRLTLIPGGEGLIQTERYSFHREYSQPCFLMVIAIFDVSFESGVISHTPPHVLTPVLCGVEEVSIFLCLQITLLSFGNTHRDNQTYLYMKWDRQVDCQKGIKERGEEKKWRFPYIVGFLKRGLDDWGGEWLLMGRNERALLVDVTGRDCS